MSEPIRVLVVDDHSVVRQGIRTLLELQDGIEVVGEGSNGEEGVDAATRLRPDVILMDLVMPKLDGVSAMRVLRTRVPEARVIVLTSFLDDDKLLPALRAGAAVTHASVEHLRRLEANVGTGYRKRKRHPHKFVFRGVDLTLAPPSECQIQNSTET